MLGCLDVVLGKTRHDFVADEGRLPLRARGLPVERLPRKHERVPRREFGRRDFGPAHGRHDPVDEPGMMRRHQFGAEEEALGVADPRDLFRGRRLLLLHLLQLFLRQDRAARPEDEAGGLPAHRLAPETQALVENVGEIETDFAPDAAAGVHVDPLDLARRHVGIGEIPADDRMAFAFEGPRKIEAKRIGEPGDVVARRHALHAADPDEGAVIPLFRDQRVAMRGLDVAIAGKGLLQRQRQAGQQARNGAQHPTPPRNIGWFARVRPRRDRRSAADKCPRRRQRTAHGTEAAGRRATGRDPRKPWASCA